MIEDSKRILKSTFGYDRFLPLQERIIKSVLEGKDTVALLPTGGGKSLCYQIPGLQLEGLCLVISPLVALIKDQVRQLNKKNIKAIGITGAVRLQELDDLLDNAIYGNYKFLYLSPERLKHPLVQQRIEKMSINLIAIDEAHCISEWGHDFRPAYREIAVIKELQPHIPLIALTATATAQVQADIKANLKLKDPVVYKNSFNRENITYHIADTPDKRNAAAAFYKKFRGSSIAYVRSRNNCLEYAQFLNEKKVSTTFYHGGLDPKARDQSMNEWMTDERRVMVATNAFGMGIDKPDVRTILHLQLPDSIESYYQETGRAGRDNKPSRAQFIYNINDLNHAHNQFIKNLPTVAMVKELYRNLCNYLQVPLNEGVEQSFQFSFVVFCERYNYSAAACYNILQALDRYNVLKLETGAFKRSSVRFRESAKNIASFTTNDTAASTIMHTLMRIYGSSQQQDIYIDTGLIALRSNCREFKVLEVLEKMHQREVLEINIMDKDTLVTFLVPRENDRTINKFATTLNRQNQHKKDKLDHMMRLVQERDECLQNLILRYFDEQVDAPCGHCSNCLKELKKEEAIDKQDLLKYLSKSKSFHELQLESQATATQLTKQIRALLENGRIKITDDNKYIANE